MNKSLSQEQFGKNAAHYLTSTPHATGKSLQRLVDLTSPQKSWRVLDIATGGGHVAYTFAPHVARVWATDITQEMLDMVKLEAAKRGLANLRTTYAKAEALPFEDESFELVTCRVAPHHFDSIPEFLAETRRVLRPIITARDQGPFKKDTFAGGGRVLAARVHQLGERPASPRRHQRGSLLIRGTMQAHRQRIGTTFGGHPTNARNHPHRADRDARYRPFQLRQRTAF